AGHQQSGGADRRTQAGALRLPLLMTLRRLRHLSLVLLVFLVLGACGGGDDEAEPTAAPTTTPTVEAAPEGEAFTGGSIATDGICQINIPDDWVDDGTGRGETATGDRWTLFGGTAATDAAWTSARDLLKGQFASREGATVEETDSSVTITLPNGRGLYVRERFENRYCEFGVTSSGEESGEVVMLWRSVANSLQLLQPEE
ncbi:MAG: hypothetical protein M3Y37_06195, partial [Chloroflexota bacterium]|nr:hypothetical protein [Chloroflexota bacterium]